MPKKNLITEDALRPRDLATLANDINDHHDRATRHSQQAIEHAIACGRLLIQAKSQVGHGGFVPWLKANCAVKERQAQNYMRVAQNWKVIESKNAPGADLTIKGALGLLTDERTTRLADHPRVESLHANRESLRVQSNRLCIKHLDRMAAIGHVLTWGDSHGYGSKTFAWLWELTVDERHDLITSMAVNDTVEAINEMIDEFADAYDLPAPLFPDGLVAAIYIDMDKPDVADAIARDVRERFAAAGITERSEPLEMTLEEMREFAEQLGVCFDHARRAR